MRLILWAALGAALFGCAAARLSHDLQPYVGRDIHELTAHLGAPTGEREGTGERESTADRVYVWSISSEGLLPTGSPMSTGSTTERTMTVEHECTLEVTVNAQRVIQSYRVEGSDAGCAAFRRHLVR